MRQLPTRLLLLVLSASAAAAPPGYVEVSSRAALVGALVSNGTTKLYVPSDVSIPLNGAEIIISGPMNVTIMGGGVIDAQFLSRVFTVTMGAQLTLDAVTITNGQATYAGCLLVESAGLLTSLTLQDMRMLNCRAETAGGLLAVSAAVSIFNSTIDSVSASCGTGPSAHGGALLVEGGGVAIEDSHFRNATVHCANGDSSAGFLLLVGGAVAMRNSSVVGAAATSVYGEAVGGGISVLAGKLTIFGSTLEHITASVSVDGRFAKGGLMFASWGEVIVEATTLAHTFALFGDDGASSSSSSSSSSSAYDYGTRKAWGGSIYQEGGTLTLDGVQVVDTAVRAYGGGKGTVASGGAIHVDGGQATITGCEFRNNSAATGDADGSETLACGLFMWIGTMQLTDTLIADCAATSGRIVQGGAVMMFSGTLSAERVRVVRSSVHSAMASAKGGGVMIGGGTASMINSTIAHCSASTSGGAGVAAEGAALHLFGGSTQLGGVDIVDCHATSFSGAADAVGGGIFAQARKAASWSSPADSTGSTELSLVSVALSIERSSCSALQGGRAFGGAMYLYQGFYWHDSSSTGEQQVQILTSLDFYDTRLVDNWVTAGSASSSIPATRDGMQIYMSEDLTYAVGGELTVEQSPLRFWQLAISHNCSSVPDGGVDDQQQPPPLISVGPSVANASAGNVNLYEDHEQRLSAAAVTIDAIDCAPSPDLLNTVPLAQCGSQSHTCGPEATCQSSEIVSWIPPASLPDQSLAPSAATIRAAYSPWCSCSPGTHPVPFLFDSIRGSLVDALDFLDLETGFRPNQIGPYKGGCKVPLYVEGNTLLHTDQGEMHMTLVKDTTHAPSTRRTLDFYVGGSMWTGVQGPGPMGVPYYLMNATGLPSWLQPVAPWNGTVRKPDETPLADAAMGRVQFDVRSVNLPSRTSVTPGGPYSTTVQVCVILQPGGLFASQDLQQILTPQVCGSDSSGSFQMVTMEMFLAVEAVPVAPRCTLDYVATADMVTGLTLDSFHYVLTFIAKDIDGQPIDALSGGTQDTLGFTAHVSRGDNAPNENELTKILRSEHVEAGFDVAVRLLDLGPATVSVALNGELLPWNVSVRGSCPLGTFAGAAVDSSYGVCVPCDEKTECSNLTSITTLELKPNWWRASNATTDIRRCTPVGVALTPTPCSHGGSVAGEYCHSGLTGPLCRVCSSKGFYFHTQTMRCKQCPLVGASALLPLVGTVVGVALLVWLLYRAIFHLFYASRADDLRAGLQRLRTYAYRIGLVPKFKLCISYFQVLVALPQTFGIGESMPAAYMRTLGYFRIFSFDLLSFVSVAPRECIGSYAVWMSVEAVSPLVIVAAVGLIATALTVRQRARSLGFCDAATTAVLVVGGKPRADDGGGDSSHAGGNGAGGGAAAAGVGAAAGKSRRLSALALSSVRTSMRHVLANEILMKRRPKQQEQQGVVDAAAMVRRGASPSQGSSASGRSKSSRLSASIRDERGSRARGSSRNSNQGGGGGWPTRGKDDDSDDDDADSNGGGSDDEGAAAAGEAALAEERSLWTLVGLQVLPVVLPILFAFVPSVSSSIFAAFSCDCFGTSDVEHNCGGIGKELYLHADYSIACSGPQYSSLLRRAWFLILCWPVGVPILFGVLLYIGRDAILRRRQTALSRATRFLHVEYRRGAFCWELVELGRKLFLLGFLQLLGDSASLLRPSLALLVTCSHMTLLHAASPYKHASTSYFAMAVHLTLATQLIGGIIVKVWAHYDFSTAFGLFRGFISVDGLALYLIAFNFLVLVVLGVLLAQQMRELKGREMRERRLRWRTTREKVYAKAPTLSQLQAGNGRFFHVFLSHEWSSGQEKMRVTKQRLSEMVGGLNVFLDVDDLNDVAELEACIDASGTVLVCCSVAYCQSMNCMRELRRAVQTRRPLIALLEGDEIHGAITQEEMAIQLELAERRNAGWGFDSGNGALTGAALAAALFEQPPIEWTRTGAYQARTLQLLAERILGSAAAGRTYVVGESWESLPWQPRRQLPSLDAPCHPLLHFHVYASPHNQGAAELVHEIATSRGLAMSVTTERDNIPSCMQMLVYLTGNTWQGGGGGGGGRGSMSDSGASPFVQDVAHALSHGVPLVLVHEQPGHGQEGRAAVPFSTFFEAGQTPPELLGAGIYRQIATPLRGGALRPVGLALAAAALGEQSSSAALDGRTRGQRLQLWLMNASGLARHAVSPASHEKHARGNLRQERVLQGDAATTLPALHSQSSKGSLFSGRSRLLSRKAAGSHGSVVLLESGRKSGGGAQYTPSEVELA